MGSFITAIGRQRHPVDPIAARRSGSGVERPLGRPPVNGVLQRRTPPGRLAGWPRTQSAPRYPMKIQTPRSWRGTYERLAETTQRLDQRLDQTNDRLDQTNVRLGRLERRHADSEIRLATEIVAVADAVREVRDLLREDRALRGRVDDHERCLTAIEQARG